MCAISWLGELTVWGVVPAVSSANVLISGVVGLLLIGVGNYLPREAELYARHQDALGCRSRTGAVRSVLAAPALWCCTGLIVMGVAGSVLSSEVVAAVIAVLAFGSVGAVYVYSYLLWRKSQRAAR